MTSTAAVELAKKGKWPRSFRVRITVTVSSMIVGVSLTTAAITTAILLRASHNIAISRARANALNLATLTSRLIDVDQVRQIKSPKDHYTSKYLTQQKILSDVVHATSGVGYAYIWKLKKAPEQKRGFRALWVVDNEPIGSKMFKPVGAEYPVGSLEDRGLDEVFRTGKGAADPDLYTDYAGTWISGYVPLAADKNAGEILIVGVDISVEHIEGVRKSLVAYILMASGLALLLTIPIGIAAGNWMCRPLKVITERLRHLSNLELNKNLEPISAVWIMEIDQLRDAIERLSTAMSSFSLYLPRDVVKKLLATNQMAKRGGSTKELAIMFTDIRNFTGYTETTPTALLLDKLNTYLTLLGDQITQNQGTVDKYIGDSVMAFWGAPNDVSRPASKACTSALEIRKIYQQLAEMWQAEGLDLNFYTRVGIHYGSAVVGNLGSDERINYTAIGDSINTASRLEAVNKQYNTDIIVSHAVVAAVGKENAGSSPFLFRKIDTIPVRGKTQKVEIYALEGLSASSLVTT